MRNSLLMGVTVSALAFAAVPASAQVAANAPIAAQRSQDDAGERDDYDDSYGYESSYGPYRPAGFGVQVYGGGSANEYGPYGYPGSRLRRLRRVGLPQRRFVAPRAPSTTAGARATTRGSTRRHYGRYEPLRHRYYRSTRGWNPRFGGRDAYDVNYRNGFRSGYEEGYRAARRSRRW